MKYYNEVFHYDNNTFWWLNLKFKRFDFKLNPYCKNCTKSSTKNTLKSDYDANKFKSYKHQSQQQNPSTWIKAQTKLNPSRFPIADLALDKSNLIIGDNGARFKFRNTPGKTGTETSPVTSEQFKSVPLYESVVTFL